MVQVTNYKWRGYDENKRKIIIYGSWWPAGIGRQIVGQFVFSPVQAQVSAQDATFKKVRCEELIVGNTSKAVVVYVNYTG